MFLLCIQSAIKHRFISGISRSVSPNLISCNKNVNVKRADDVEREHHITVLTFTFLWWLIKLGGTEKKNIPIFKRFLIAR